MAGTRVRAQAICAAPILVSLIGSASVGSASAQVIQLSAGASTVYAAEGGAVTITNDKTQTTFGAGLVNGHFVAGGSSLRAVAGGTAIAGQQTFRVDLPTDVFDSSYAFFGTGLGFKSNPHSTTGLNAFAGFQSQDGGTPLFQAASVQQATALAQYRRPTTKNCSALATGIRSQHTSLLASYTCNEAHGLRYAATLGEGAGSPYAAASVVLDQQKLRLKAAYLYAGPNFQRGNNIYLPSPEPLGANVTAEYNLSRQLVLSAMHQRYYTPQYLDIGTSTINPAIKSSLDSVSASLSAAGASLSIALLNSSFQQTTSGAVSEGDKAISVNLRKDFGRFSWTENLLHSASTTSTLGTTLRSGLGVTINPHLRITESVNVDGTNTTFSHGGAWVTTFSSVEVDYQLLYLVTRPQNPFQQVIVFDAHLRLPKGLTLHASSTFDPTGRVVYTVQLETSLVHTPTPQEIAPTANFGTNLVRGRVVDPDGKGIDGAALMIDAHHVYSDSEGWFLFRERHSQSHTLRVLTDDFLDSVSYVEVAAPHQVTSGAESELITVVVMRTAQRARRRIPQPVSSDQSNQR